LIVSARRFRIISLPALELLCLFVPGGEPNMSTMNRRSPIQVAISEIRVHPGDKVVHEAAAIWTSDRLFRLFMGSCFRRERVSIQSVFDKRCLANAENRTAVYELL